MVITEYHYFYHVFTVIYRDQKKKDPNFVWLLKFQNIGFKFHLDSNWRLLI